MQQTGADFFPSIFDHREALSEIHGNMTSLAALFVDPNRHTAGTAESVQAAQKLVTIHQSNIGQLRPAGIAAGVGLS